MEITGGCLCGAVRYRSTAAPLVTRACWCRLCQYIGAGSGTVNVCFRRADVTITGELEDFASTADSGNWVNRCFCPHCGVHVYAQISPRPDLIMFRAGTLDDPNIADPSGTVWTKMAPTWACFDPSQPLHEGRSPVSA